MKKEVGAPLGNKWGYVLNKGAERGGSGSEEIVQTLIGKEEQT